MSKFKTTILNLLASIGFAFIVSCQHSHLVSSESNITHYDLKDGEAQMINLPKIDMEYNYAVFRFPTEPGKIYEITVECSTDVVVYREKLAKEYYQVLYKDNWGSRIGDTLLFGVDKPSISELTLAVSDTGRTTFNIKLSIQKRMAWWVMPKDSIRSFHYNGNSQINSLKVIPYDTGVIIDTSVTWETRAFLEPDLSEMQRYRIPYDSVSTISDWFRLQNDPNYRYILHLQYLRRFPPYVNLIDENGNVHSPSSIKSSCNDYAVCQIDFSLPYLANDALYIHFSAEIQLRNFIDERFRFGVEQIHRSTD